MQNNDRKGKWQSFDALRGFSDSIKKAGKEKEKIKKPVLFPDELEQLDRNLKEALEFQTNCCLEVFEGGYIIDYCGIIKSINLVSHLVTLKTCDEVIKIKATNIVGIKLNT